MSALPAPPDSKPPRRRRASGPSNSRDPLVGLGEWGQFIWAAIREIRRLGPFAGEVLRQAAIIATGSTLVIVFVTFLIGGSCGVEASFVGQQIGAGIAAPFFASVCTVRDIVPVLFGMILAAKLGCGMVAELGAMRVNEEVDAIEVMGISSMAYLVSTRIVAASIVIPPVYLASRGGGAVRRLADLARALPRSLGRHLPGRLLHRLSPHRPRLLAGEGRVRSSSSCWRPRCSYGYRVAAGRSRSGRRAARSMRVNLVLIAPAQRDHEPVLWGFKPPFPIA